MKRKINKKNKFITHMILFLLILALINLFISCNSKTNNPETKKDKKATTNVQEEELPEIKTEDAIKELIIEPSDLTLSSGKSEQIKIKALLENDSIKDINSDETMYEVSDSDVINITEDGTITVNENAETGQKATVKAYNNEKSAELTVTIQQSLDSTIDIDEEGKAIVNNPNSIQVLVNKQRNLPNDYKPEDLVKPDIPYSFQGENEKRYLRQVAATALEELVAQAKEENIYIVGVSGFRSYQRQETIFNWNVQQSGFEEATKFSAQPGQSEHQTGLAIDVSAQSVGFGLTQNFGDTVEGKWLKDNAHKFGFIIRYPKGKEDLTGYSYEPWHIRYVGKDIASVVYENDFTLEQYFESLE